MTAKMIWERIGARLTDSPLIGVGIALVLMTASLFLAFSNEHFARTQQVRRAEVQARILAGSVAAPLSFDDAAATREYIDALKVNPEVRAVAAFDAEGRLAGGYSRGGAAVPQSNRLGPARLEGGDLIVTEPVREGGARLGSVYLRIATETLSRRLNRYVGIATIVIMASLMVAVLGASYASLNRTNVALREEIEGRRKAEEALRQAQKMEAMGQLVGGVAHDFNNLLMVASSGLDLMDRTTDPARRERLKEGVRNAVDRGAKLTQQLLAFARRSPLNPEVVNLEAAIRSMQDLLERSLREDIVVRTVAQPGVWPIEVDASQLEVAVLNIAINARDAMPGGGVIRIEMANEPGNEGTPDRVRLAITDTGVGMTPEMIAQVFEPFFTTKEVGHGTGLGLSQVYGFVRSSGGEVGIESEVGRGTTVFMLIPRCLKGAQAHPAAVQEARKPPRRRCRVLLVEDDDQVAGLVTQMLDDLGYDVVRAPAAAPALDVLESGATIDLVFSDMLMPGDMNGLELARKIAAQRPNLPIVLTTGYSSAAKSAAAEGLRLLVKPYRMSALAAELEAALAETHSA